MVKKRTVALLLLLAGGTALASEDIAAWKGRKTAVEITENLRKRVLATMRDSGPVSAVSVCAYQARAVERDAMKREGVTAKRTSSRIRNPENAPDDYEKGVLERFEVLAREGNLPEEQVELREVRGVRSYRYTKPILVDDRCLTCHGGAEQIPEGVRRVLAERYPQDGASGYKAGDFRGIVSIVIPEELAR